MIFRVNLWIVVQSDQNSVSVDFDIVFLLQRCFCRTKYFCGNTTDEFAFVFSPVPFRGATGSPGNPIAVR